MLFVARLIEFLFANTPDMWEVSILSHSLMASGIVIPFVKT